MIKFVISIGLIATLLGCSSGPPPKMTPVHVGPVVTFTKKPTAHVHGDVSIKAVNASPLHILQSISKSSNLVLHIKGASLFDAISIDIRDEPLDKAIQKIARANGLIGIVDYNSRSIIITANANFQFKMNEALSSKLKGVYSFREYLHYKKDSLALTPSGVVGMGSLAELDKSLEMVKSILGSDMVHVELIIKG